MGGAKYSPRAVHGSCGWVANEKSKWLRDEAKGKSNWRQWDKVMGKSIPENGTAFTIATQRTICSLKAKCFKL